MVFADKDLALKAAKRVKGSRFKGFKCETEAQQFSRLTAESAFQSPKKLPKEVQLNFDSLNHPKCELNSHCRRFWPVKIAPTTII